MKLKLLIPNFLLIFVTFTYSSNQINGILETNSYLLKTGHYTYPPVESNDEIDLYLFYDYKDTNYVKKWSEPNPGSALLKCFLAGGHTHRHFISFSTSTRDKTLKLYNYIFQLNRKSDPDKSIPPVFGYHQSYWYEDVSRKLAQSYKVPKGGLTLLIVNGKGKVLRRFDQVNLSRKTKCQVYSLLSSVGAKRLTEYLKEFPTMEGPMTQDCN